MLWTLNALWAAGRTAGHSLAASSTSQVPVVAATLQQIAVQAHGAWRSVQHSAFTAADVHASAREYPRASQPPSPGSTSGAEDLDLDLGEAPGGAVHAPAVASTSGTSGQPLLPPHVLQDLRPPAQPYQLVPKQAQRAIATPALYTPWTPTRALQRRRHVAKRMGFLVHVLEREQLERAQQARPLPQFRAGDILELRMLIPEAERKIAVYRGVCIARYDKGLRTSFKIYNVFPDCGGVVQHLPLYMPDLLGLRVVGRIPAKQERLYYLLERQSTDYTFQTNVTAAT